MNRKRTRSPHCRWQSLIDEDRGQVLHWISLSEGMLGSWAPGYKEVPRHMLTSFCH
jgi:hypothetical protein